jgi:hypothetical protein
MSFSIKELVEITKSSNGVPLPSEMVEMEVTYAVKVITVTSAGVVASVHRSLDGGQTWGLYKDFPIPSATTLDDAEAVVKVFMQ